MKQEKITIGGIPAIVWGEKSDKAYIFVHGKMSAKEYAEQLARIADEKGIQTISFDLPEHGERKDENRRCDVWNGVADLTTIADYVFDRWRTVSLFACSLGAFFSLHAYKNRALEKCLFMSPIADMEYLIHQMFTWFNVTEEQLREQGEIPTPVDILSWRYYGYVRENPIEQWDFPTSVLYGTLDNMQSREVIESFCDKFGCKLTVSDGSEHPFMAESDTPIVEKWLRENV